MECRSVEVSALSLISSSEISLGGRLGRLDRLTVDENECLVPEAAEALAIGLDKALRTQVCQAPLHLVGRQAQAVRAFGKNERLAQGLHLGYLESNLPKQRSKP